MGVGVVVVGVVVGVVLGAGLFWFWAVAVGSPAEVGGAGVACTGDAFGGTDCWGD